MDREEFATAIQLAIEREEEAHSLYRDLAGKSRDEEARRLFERLATEESIHKRNLIDLFRSLREKKH